MRKTLKLLFPLILFVSYYSASAVEVAPPITDREIIERLTRLEEGQKKLDEGLKTLDKGLNKRIDDLRSEINSRFDTLQWMLGLFITIALAIFGFILRMQWQMHRRQTQVETTLDAQKEDIAFIKRLIEKFLPPKGVL